MDTRVFRSMSYGVYVVGSMDGSRPVGCVANSIMQITSSPATVAVSLNHDNYTNSCVEKSGFFSFSILGQESDPSLIGSFGFRTSKEADKYEGVDYEMIGGCPVIKDSCGYVVCRVVNRMETATHTVFLGEVIEAEVSQAQYQPMTYAYYHQVKGGKTPPKASSFLPEEPSEGAGGAAGANASEPTKPRFGWRCTLCGHIEYVDELPDDFVCPVCGVGKDMFERIEL